MEIFISWSGERSKGVARALRSWLPKVIQRLKPWMSETDIAQGSRWADEISGKLKDCNFGVICLTPENLKEPWILFEAGALSKSLDNSRVCPVLLGMDFSSVTGPIAQFQAAQLNRDGLLKLIKSINEELEEKISDSEINEAYDLWWPKLEAQIKQIPPPKEPVETSRSQEDILHEVLGIARKLDRSTAITYSLIQSIAQIGTLSDFKSNKLLGCDLSSINKPTGFATQLWEALALLDQYYKKTDIEKSTKSTEDIEKETEE